eukprot:3293176-Amphidinium_carterae.1
MTGELFADFVECECSGAIKLFLGPYIVTNFYATSQAFQQQLPTILAEDNNETVQLNLLRASAL